MNDWKTNPFEYGNSWVRADFHLHTKADKEFSYSGELNDFTAKYVEALKAADIRVAVITNHNKFDKDEYKAIAKKARKEGIGVLPGVELSVVDHKDTQQKIVDIMEGGIEAFERRKTIYQIWGSGGNKKGRVK